MSDSNSQRPANENQSQGKKQPQPPKTGGLLSNYQQQPQSPGPKTGGLLSNYQQQPQSPGPKTGGLLSSYKSQGNPPSQAPSSPPPGWQPQGPGPHQYQGGMPPQSRPDHAPFANTVQQLRGFTNKMAAMVGHMVQPPAPPMERYRPYSANMNMNMNGGMPPTPPTSVASGLRKRPLSLKIALHKQQRRRKKSGPKKIMMTILVALLVLVVSTAFVGTAYGYSVYQQQLPKVQKYANEQIPQMTRIYDRNGVLLYQAYTNDPAIGGRRVDVSYQDIPQVMQDAMTSIEDRTFWTNNGFNATAIVRAAFTSTGGASTITQQLIKNLTGNDQISLNRKVNEVAMSVGLTQQFPKSTILTMYLNTVPFGSQDYGVEIAAEDYFGLQPTCQPNKPCVPAISMLNYDQQTKKNDPILGLARASLLAGIPNAPYTYDPTLGATHKKAAVDRQYVVLKAMQSNNILIDGKPITNAMIDQAQALAGKMTFNPPQNIKRAPGFVDYVIHQVETALGNGNPNNGVEAFITGGYNIRTTIDANLNDYTQAAVERHLYQPEVQKGPQAVCGLIVLANSDNGYCNGKGLPSNVKNGAVVVQDVKNGEILAMVGSANYNSSAPEVEGQINMADTPRQPGSTFKLFDYATAFEMGWSPGITLADTMTAFPNGGGAGTPVPPSETDAVQNAGNYPGVYLPSDYGATWWNYMESITWATANSMNVPAIRAMQFAGPQAVKELAERLGVTFLPTQSFGYSAAIGADEVTPLQMVNAYATFGNGGVRVPPQTILDIWNNNGQSLYHYDENNAPGVRVVSPQVAYEMTMALSDEPARTFEFDGDQDLSFADVNPTCQTSDICSVQLAAKTGTTDNFTDNWTIGYTPEVAVGVWVGNDNNSPLLHSIGITGAAPIFHSVMERVLGWCNDSSATQPNPNSPYAASEVDNIPCGQGGAYNFPFSGHPQLAFPNPGGVTQGYAGGGLLVKSTVSTDGNGLGANNPLSSGSGSQAIESDWMLDGE